MESWHGLQGVVWLGDDEGEVKGAVKIVRWWLRLFSTCYLEFVQNFILAIISPESSVLLLIRGLFIQSLCPRGIVSSCSWFFIEHYSFNLSLFNHGEQRWTIVSSGLSLF
jgi:hypothetical protein